MKEQLSDIILNGINHFNVQLQAILLKCLGQITGIAVLTLTSNIVSNDNSFLNM